MNAPQTIDEWQAYVATLEGENLRSKAIAANSYRFVQMLQEEGYSPSDISTIYRMFARQFVLTGQAAPTEGYVDYQRMGEEDFEGPA